MNIIIVNGDQCQVESTCTVADLVTRLQMMDKRIAVEVNMEIIPRSLFANTRLHAGDRIEIVHAIGGG